MPLEYPSGVVKEHTAVREAVGIFDVSHLGKAMVTGPGAAAYVNATLTNDLGQIAPGKAQYTLCCDDETGGIVDDLIAYYHDDEHVLLVPNAANTAEVVRRLPRQAPDGRQVRRPPPRLRRARGAGHRRPTRCSTRSGCPTGHEYMSFVEAEFADAGRSWSCCRTGYTGERGYELIAANEVAGALWDALLEAGRGARDAAVRPRRPRHPAHRDGLPAARPGHLPRRHPQPGPARLGRRLEEGARSGAATRSSPRRRPARSGVLRGLVATGRGIPRPGMSVSLTPDVPLCEITSGTFSPDAAQGHRPGAGADRS